MVRVYSNALPIDNALDAVVVTVAGPASGVADSGVALKIGGVYNLTKPTLDDGDRGDVQLNDRGALLTSLYDLIFGEDALQGVLKTEVRMNYTNFTASSQILAGPGRVFGIIINSHSSGTLKLWDALTATGNVVMNTYTFTAGSGYINFPGGIILGTGLFATIGGTVDLTILTKLDN